MSSVKDKRSAIKIVIGIYVNILYFEALFLR